MRRNAMTILILLPVIAVLGLIFCVFFVPGFFYRIAIDRRQEPEALPRWIDTAGYEVVSLQSADGLLLRGRFIPAPEAAPTVIMAHGYHGNGRQMSDFARFFKETLHYKVLIPDARGHGLSEGDYVGFGWPERLDYLRWIDWVLERDRPGARIVLFGVSMGAATVMMCAGEDLPPQVKALIEDCGYTSVADELGCQLRQTYHISGPPGAWLLKATSRLTGKRAGYTFEEASALEQIKKARIPILFIHGDADTYVPFRMVHTLYDACPTEKDLYIAKGAGHGQAWETNPAEYQERIARFLEKHLPGKGSSHES
jgi:fermentation-respiration switch protein FrsA (DUF1100 family)